MLRLRDIMTTNVVTVSPEMTLREAAELLVRRHMSGAPVAADGHVLGVVSATDLLSFVALMPGVPVEYGTGEDEDGLEDEPLPPEGTDPPATFFATLWADTGNDVNDRLQGAPGWEWSALEEHTVSEVMNPRVHALPPDISIDRAAAFMRTADVHRVLVMDGDRLTGIVTTKDISNAVADHMRRDTLKRSVGGAT